MYTEGMVVDGHLRKEPPYSQDLAVYGPDPTKVTRSCGCPWLPMKSMRGGTELLADFGPSLDSAQTHRGTSGGKMRQL